MKSLKTWLLPALCVLLLLSLTACGSAGGDTADADASAPEAMSREDYLAEVNGLNEAGEAFKTATAEFLSVGLADAGDVDALTESVEKIRETRQAFLDFQSIENPAEGYEDAHAALAKDCGDFGALIDEYCDVLIGVLTDEGDYSGSDIETRMQDVLASLADSIAAVNAVE